MYLKQSGKMQHENNTLKDFYGRNPTTTLDRRATSDDASEQFSETVSSHRLLPPLLLVLCASTPAVDFMTTAVEVARKERSRLDDDDDNGL